MPKFKSINELFSDALATAKRFPMVLVFAAIGTLAMIRFVSFDYQVKRELTDLTNLSMIAALGLTAFLSLRVFAETHGWSRRKQMLITLWLTFILAGYFWSLPPQLKLIDLNRYWLINANAHLLVAIAPFLFLSNCTNAFWQYNKALFIRIIISLIYSNTIYIGIIIAMAVTDHLFVFIKFRDVIYAQLWFFVVGIFNTWFFLKGVPSNILALEGERNYPRGLRVFTQFVLIPLVVLYVSILYLYMGKIVINWTLPDGWLSSFIIGVSIMGIVTLLLVHPLKDSEEHGWIRAYSRYFYLALFPLIVLMAIAISRRISDYGITEQRYFVMLFTLWLFVVALRFTIKPHTDIRSIPLTLFVLVMIATWGPWSAISVSKWGQTARLEKLLKDNGLLKEGVLHKAENKIDAKASQEISNIVAYLEASFGLNHLEKWARPEVTVLWDNLSASKFVTDELGLEYTGHYYPRGYYGDFAPAQAYFHLSTKQDALIKVTGYDYYQQVQLYGLNNQVNPVPQKLQIPQGEVMFSFNRSKNELQVTFHEQTITLGVVNAEWITDLRQRFGDNGYNIPVEAMTFSAKGELLRAQIVMTQVSGYFSSGENTSAELHSIYGYLLISMDMKGE